jgi:hypothetical protein
LTPAIVTFDQKRLICFGVKVGIVFIHNLTANLVPFRGSR